MTNQISIIGAGSWGTALAQAISSKGTPVILWTRSLEQADIINSAGENPACLPGVTLSKNITATTNLPDAAKSPILLIVTPAQAVRSTLESLKPHLTPEQCLIHCSKGIELDSGKFISDISQEILPQTPCAILTGPNFAHEIARGLPAATTLACADEAVSEKLQIAIASKTFRPYLTDDLIGAQLAGALKNVIAIACGIAHGLSLGESARASLVTRGLAEIVRLGAVLGARPETFMGLSGIGDLMLTCSSIQSRNFSLGAALGQGETLAAILESRRAVTEGVHTARAAHNLAQKNKIDMPICTAVHKCLNEALPIDAALKEMLNRPLGKEYE
ncbi:MAG: NAD(P)-dependent glycerol-3-phosphate dehydrogenase [Alphaproteobacteria bacterium]|nr:NAD(P)-dependent glycerol-3-phosphate dehydrogenase [Alphaproteobacteria bacterium]